MHDLGEKAMSPNAKHTLGAFMMWGGLPLAAAGALIVAPSHPAAGAGMLAAALAVSLGGAALKKRHCPRCRAGACELPGPPGAKNGPNPPA